jgi:hypothetical protein
MPHSHPHPHLRQNTFIALPILCALSRPRPAMKDRQLHPLGPPFLRLVQRSPKRVLLLLILIARKNAPEDRFEGFPQRRQVGDDDADGDFGYAPDGEGDGFVVRVFEATDAEVVAQFEGRDGRAACRVSFDAWSVCGVGLCVTGGKLTATT